MDHVKIRARMHAATCSELLSRLCEPRLEVQVEVHRGMNSSGRSRLQLVSACCVSIMLASNSVFIENSNGRPCIEVCVRALRQLAVRTTQDPIDVPGTFLGILSSA